MLIMDVPRQTALLENIRQLLPRLFNGIGPRWGNIVSIQQSQSALLANITMLFSISSQPTFFEQVSPG
jgi:hypothetical protein